MSSGDTKKMGLGLFEALFLTFLILKLTHVIDWSWWWVTAPLWGCVVLVLVVAVVLGTIEWLKINKNR